MKGRRAAPGLTVPVGPRVRIAVFASGNGSNFQAVADAGREGRLGGGSVEVLVCDNEDAFALERAKAFGIPTQVVERGAFPSRDAFDDALLAILHVREIDMVVLAGWMRLLGPRFVSAYRGRIVNVHPSLLPAFPGLHAIRQALAAGVKVTGVTVHFVDEGIDTGPIIAQGTVEVLPGDSEASLAARIQPVEHRLLPRAVADVVAGRVAWGGDRVLERRES